MNYNFYVIESSGNVLGTSFHSSFHSSFDDSAGILETTVTYQGNPSQGSPFQENPLDRVDLLESVEQLILERNSFELMIFDYLVEPTIPDDFWDPVVVCLSKEHIDSLEQLEINDTCFICTMESNLFRKMHCCNKEICNECVYKWFEKSVKCPFCMQDLREVSI